MTFRGFIGTAEKRIEPCPSTRSRENCSSSVAFSCSRTSACAHSAAPRREMTPRAG
jgi:hypothetical protein